MKLSGMGIFEFPLPASPMHKVHGGGDNKCLLHASRGGGDGVCTLCKIKGRGIFGHAIFRIRVN